jgi:hypothetical protein
MVTRARATAIALILLLGTSCAQTQIKRPLTALPDAPSSHLSTLNDNFRWLGNALDFPIAADVTKSNPEGPALITALRFNPFDQDAVARNQFASFLNKYLYSVPFKTAAYRSSTNGNLLSRSTDAASQLIMTHNDSGDRVLNVRYLIAALTSAAADTARQPSWAQSTSGTFSDFGSNLGSDAGMNVFRQFQPGIRKMLDSHSPGFVRRLEGITKD